MSSLFSLICTLLVITCRNVHFHWCSFGIALSHQFALFSKTGPNFECYMMVVKWVMKQFQSIFVAFSLFPELGGKKIPFILFCHTQYICQVKLLQLWPRMFTPECRAVLKEHLLPVSALHPVSQKMRYDSEWKQMRQTDSGEKEKVKKKSEQTNDVFIHVEGNKESNCCPTSFVPSAASWDLPAGPSVLSCSPAGPTCASPTRLFCAWTKWPKMNTWITIWIIKINDFQIYTT